MKFHVHLKDEAGRDDSVTVEADSELSAIQLGMVQSPTAVDAIDAYPAWDPATSEDEGWAR